MKNRSIFLFALTFNFVVSAQVDTDWIHQLERLDVVSILPKSIQVDDIGNYYLMGQSGSLTLDMDTLPEIRSVGGKRGFVAKFDMSGKPLWLKDDSLGYTTVETFIDENDNFHVVKHFGPSTYNILYSKHDTAWSVLKQKTIVELLSSGGSADLYDLKIRDSILYIAFLGVNGEFRIGHTELSPEGHTLYVVKYNLSLDSLVYLHQFQSNQITNAHILLNSKDEIYVLSDFSQELLVAKILHTGEVATIKHYTNLGISAQQVLFRNSHLYIVGRLIGGTYAFDQIKVFSYGGPFILKLSEDLEAISYRSIGISGPDSHASSFDFMEDGAIIIAGGYQGKKITENGDTLPSDGFSRKNSFLAILDSNMNSICMHGIATKGDNFIDYIKVHSNRVLMAGHYACELTLGDNMLDSDCKYTNVYDGYFADISISDFCNETVNLKEAKIVKSTYTIYPNPCQGVLRIHSKTNIRFPVEVFDSEGTLVLKEPNWISDTTSAKLESPGTYFIQIRDRHMILTYKFIATGT